MNTTKYIVKRIEYYLLYMVAALVLWGIVYVGFGVRMGSGAQDAALTAVIFGYPVYRLIKKTIFVVVDYFDESTGMEVNIFARVCEIIAPKFIAGSRKRIFLLNLFSKFIQMCLIGIIIYSFTAKDYPLLRNTFVLSVMIAGLIAFLLLRIWTIQHQQQKKQAVDELSRAQTAAGFAADPARRAKFMQFPKRLLIANCMVVAGGVADVVLYPQPHWMIFYYISEFIKIAGFVGLFTLFFAVFYYCWERERSWHYSLEIGKGEYGQTKVEYYRYEGFGDVLREQRNKIDRVEDLEVQGRYIVVIKAAQVTPVRIPRTCENETLLVETLEKMIV